MGKTMSYNIEVEQGSTFLLELTINTQSGPMDLTGYTGKCQIRDEIDGVVLAEAEVTIEDALDGKLSVMLTDEQTLAIPVEVTAVSDKKKYVYDVIITSSDGVALKVLKGVAIVYPGVSK